jgi:large subunit ribosomal protein L25
MAQVSIKAEPRSDFGKGAARRIRRSGFVPAVIYGQGTELRHVALPDHELTLALRHPGLVLEVEFEGKKQLVAPRDVQRDPVRRILEHLDLVLITKAEAADRVEAGLEAEAAAAAALLEKPSNEEMDLELHSDVAAPVVVDEDVEA